MVMRKYSLILLVILFSQCKEVADSDAIVGTWYSESIETIWNYGSDSAQSELVLVENFPELYQISDVISVYNPDSTFSSTYYGIDGEDMGTDKGLWYLEQDSIKVIYGPVGQVDTFTYAYSLEGNTGTFEILRDRDNDGLKDDYIILVSRIEK